MRGAYHRPGEAPALHFADDPILKRFRVAFDEICDERLERVMLSGSARSAMCADLDYDVAGFLTDFVDRWQANIPKYLNPRYCPEFG